MGGFTGSLVVTCVNEKDVVCTPTEADKIAQSMHSSIRIASHTTHKTLVFGNVRQGNSAIGEYHIDFVSYFKENSDVTVDNFLRNDIDKECPLYTSSTGKFNSFCEYGVCYKIQCLPCTINTYYIEFSVVYIRTSCIYK